MRFGTFTLSNGSASINSVAGRPTSRLAVVGNALRFILRLTFMRERLGYKPEPTGPFLECLSLPCSHWHFQRQPNGLVRLHGLVQSALGAPRLVPLTADVVRLETVRAVRIRRATIQ